VYHGYHIDLILLYAVDDPVGFFDQLADIFSLVLGTLRPEYGWSPICSDRRVILSTIRRA
jgi:hypothetical protein